MKLFEKIVVPGNAPVLAVGDRLQSDALLLANDALDLAVLDLPERVRADFAAFALFPRLLERRGAQQAADVVGAKRRFRVLHKYSKFTSPRAGRGSSSPNFVGDFYDHAQLRPLLLFGQDIAFFRRGEPALRRQAELIESHVFGGLVDPPLDVVLLLQLAGLRRDKTEHELLLALGKKAQRLEAAGAIAIVFEEIAFERGVT